jgi:DnaJ-class molecular chaperone
MPEQQDDAQRALPCGACRGTGTVISHLGGEPHEKPCPWCEGSGERLRGHDAQARWREPAPES